MIDFWQTEESDNHINPNAEGFNPIELLKVMNLGFTVDYGCGWGRLCKAFEPRDYLGVDASTQRIGKAKAEFPAYSFSEATHGSTTLEVETMLFYTSAVHMDAGQVYDVVEWYAPKRIVIVEVLGRKYRRRGNPPVFNRDLSDYKELLAGYTLHAALPLPIVDRPYPLTVMDWRHK